MRMKQGVLCIIVWMCLGLLQAQAQIATDILDEVSDSVGGITDVLFPGVTNIRLGAGPAVSPDYEGSDDYRIKALPLLSFRYRDLIEVDNNHLRVNFFGFNPTVHEKHFQAGPLLNINFGRDENNNPALAGLGNIGTSLELGVFGSYSLGPTRTRIRYLHGVTGGHSGTKVIGDVRVVLLKTDKAAVSASINTTWADNSYMSEYFSINPAQALASGMPRFNAGAGLKDTGIGITGNYELSRRWAILVHADYKRLLGDAADSPIVSLRGSPDQAAAGVFLIFSFEKKEPSQK